jgi:manganese-dependent inorganic pyrophosphatase
MIFIWGFIEICLYRYKKKMGDNMEDVSYITGHKNPDTDSICAAIAYAELKRKLGFKAIPVRLGNINRETQFVLEYFGVQLPEYLYSVRTQVSDLKIDIIIPMSPDISIKTAWAIMKKNNIRVIPVADENGRLLGIVTLSDITNRFMDTLENNVIASSNTPLRNIVETLNAELICGSQQDLNITGKVVIAAMTPDGMEPFIEKGDIVLVGNRKDSQVKAVEIGANCIIITCGGRVDGDALELARANKCIVMQTLYDTFTTARLINQSIPIGFTMTKESLVCFNIDDYIDSIKDKMLQTRFRSYPVVDSNNSIKGFISRFHLISPNRKNVILLDHNEKSQTVDGIEQAEISEIIDHHRIGDIQTGNPVYFKNEPIGSTSTIIANLYFENGIKPSNKIAGILCAAIISDTINFKSPTSTYTDRLTANRLAEMAGIDIEAFALALFKSGSSLDGMTPTEILNYDFKEYNFGKYKIGIGQINSCDMDSLKKIKKGLVAYMDEVLCSKDYSLLLVMVTDIFNDGSEIIYVEKNKGLITQAFNVDPDEYSVYLKGVVSRKKQIVPLLNAAVQNN